MSSDNSSSHVKFHMGQALLRVSSIYATVSQVVLEQIKNALDANAKRILVRLDRKKRHVTIRDDGDGVDVKTFNNALQQVCHSNKSVDKLGRFGIGLMSPLGKCRSFTFTSCPKDGNGEYVEWSFITGDISKEAEEVHIPRVPKPKLMFQSRPGLIPPRGKMLVPWRTEVALYDYTDDKVALSPNAPPSPQFSVSFSYKIRYSI